jgi:hypothetical protein
MFRLSLNCLLGQCSFPDGENCLTRLKNFSHRSLESASTERGALEIRTLLKARILKKLSRCVRMNDLRNSLSEARSRVRMFHDLRQQRGTEIDNETRGIRGRIDPIRLDSIGQTFGHHIPDPRQTSHRPRVSLAENKKRMPFLDDVSDIVAVETAVVPKSVRHRTGVYRILALMISEVE